ncbi:MAG: biotin/lipoyl-containing protein, partial [Acidobacteriota bacterium]
MSVEIVMPQMGESITEGTVSKWLKAVGDHIDKDEAILEISTDKVDAEVPSPGAGILLEIRHNEGETVEVGTVLAVIGAEGETPAASDNGNSGARSPAVEIAAARIDEPPTPDLLVNAARDNDRPVEMPPANTPPSTPVGDATEIVMPQMGESITEGTVSKWLKSVGDKIEKDEALLEISTDKVDAEVPSPASGTLL